MNCKCKVEVIETNKNKSKNCNSSPCLKSRDKLNTNESYNTYVESPKSSNSDCEVNESSDDFSGPSIYDIKNSRNAKSYVESDESYEELICSCRSIKEDKTKRVNSRSKTRNLNRIDNDEMNCNSDLFNERNTKINESAESIDFQHNSKRNKNKCNCKKNKSDGSLNRSSSMSFGKTGRNKNCKSSSSNRIGDASERQHNKFGKSCSFCKSSNNEDDGDETCDDDYSEESKSKLKYNLFSKNDNPEKVEKKTLCESRLAQKIKEIFDRSFYGKRPDNLPDSQNEENDLDNKELVVYTDKDFQVIVKKSKPNLTNKSSSKSCVSGNLCSNQKKHVTPSSTSINKLREPTPTQPLSYQSENMPMSQPFSTIPGINPASTNYDGQQFQYNLMSQPPISNNFDGQQPQYNPNSQPFSTVSGNSSCGNPSTSKSCGSQQAQCSPVSQPSCAVSGNSSCGNPSTSNSCGSQQAQCSPVSQSSCGVSGNSSCGKNPRSNSCGGQQAQCNLVSQPSCAVSANNACGQNPASNSCGGQQSQINSNSQPCGVPQSQAPTNTCNNQCAKGVSFGGCPNQKPQNTSENTCASKIQNSSNQNNHGMSNNYHHAHHHRAHSHSHLHHSNTHLNNRHSTCKSQTSLTSMKNNNEKEITGVHVFEHSKQQIQQQQGQFSQSEHARFHQQQHSHLPMQSNQATHAHSCDKNVSAHEQYHNQQRIANHHQASQSQLLNQSQPEFNANATNLSNGSLKAVTKHNFDSEAFEHMIQNANKNNEPKNMVKVITKDDKKTVIVTNLPNINNEKACQLCLQQENQDKIPIKVGNYETLVSPEDKFKVKMFLYTGDDEPDCEKKCKGRNQYEYSFNDACMDGNSEACNFDKFIRELVAADAEKGNDKKKEKKGKDDHKKSKDKLEKEKSAPEIEKTLSQYRIRTVSDHGEKITKVIDAEKIKESNKKLKANKKYRSDNKNKILNLEKDIVFKNIRDVAPEVLGKQIVIRNKTPLKRKTLEKNKNVDKINTTKKIPDKVNEEIAHENLVNEDKKKKKSYLKIFSQNNKEIQITEIKPVQHNSENNDIKPKANIHNIIKDFEYKIKNKLSKPRTKTIMFNLKKTNEDTHSTLQTDKIYSKEKPIFDPIQEIIIENKINIKDINEYNENIKTIVGNENKRKENIHENKPIEIINNDQIENKLKQNINKNEEIKNIKPVLKNLNIEKEIQDKLPIIIENENKTLKKDLEIIKSDANKVNVLKELKLNLNKELYSKDINNKNNIFKNKLEKSFQELLKDTDSNDKLDNNIKNNKEILSLLIQQYNNLGDSQELRNNYLGQLINVIDKLLEQN